MPGLLENRIASALPDAAAFTVRLTWRNGATTLADFGELATRGVFTALRDPDLFMRVGTRHGGRVLAWSDELELDADALWFDAHPQDNPFAAAPPAPASVHP